METARVLLSILGAVALVCVGLGALVLGLAWGIRRLQPLLDDASVPPELRPAGSPLWPVFQRPAQAERVARQAAVLAFLLAGFQALMVALRALPPPGLLDAVAFAAVGLGLWRCSRTAALAGLLLYGTGAAWAVRTLGFPSPLAPVLLVGFAYGLRATFAFHRLQRSAAPPVGTRPASSDPGAPG